MTRHLIDELVFDIAIDSRSRAMGEDACLSRLVRGTLLPVVEQVFDAFDAGDMVLVLPSLEIDLGAIAEADYEDTAPERLRAALDDALHRALAQARRAHGGAAGSSGGAAPSGLTPTIVGRQESELAQLGRFLETGTMPWHADVRHGRLHEALLERLLAQGGAGLWAVLARALADPHAARRLVEQFPEHQLLAVLRGAAGADAAQFEALLVQIKDARPGASLPAAAWVQILAACTGVDEPEAGPACARIRAALAPAAAGAHALADSFQGDGLAALVHFLDSGVLPAVPGEPAQPAHEVLLERLLAGSGEAAWTVLARALVQPRCAYRFVEQFPECQLLAVVRRMAGAGAARFEALLAEAAGWPEGRAGDTLAEVRARVLAACAAGAVVAVQAEEAEEVRAPVRVAAGQSVAVDGPSLDIASLAQFLESGLLHGGPGDAPGQAAHEALLERLLAQDDARLCSVLARALADPRSARRLVEQFPERQLVALLGQAAPEDAERFGALLAEARQSARATNAAPTMPMASRSAVPTAAGAGATGTAWRLLRAGSMQPGPAQARAREAPGLFGLLADFLAGATLSTRRGGAPAHAGLLGALLAQGGAAPAVPRRGMLQGRPQGRLQGSPQDALKSAPIDTSHRHAPHPGDRASGQPGSYTQPDAQSDPRSYSGRLRHLQQFLQNGRLPHAAGGADERRLYEALLDDVIKHADDALWRIVSRALGQADSAARLMTQFPQRQLIALVRKSAPGYAPALERLVRRLSAVQAGRGDGGGGGERRARVCRRHVLAACVARPALQALPAPIYARVALELDGATASGDRAGLQAGYARRSAAYPAEASMPWRASPAERLAGRSLIRLAGLVEQFRPLIDNGCEPAPTPVPVPAPLVIEPPHAAAPDLGLVLRQREHMARALHEECRALEALLSGGTPRAQARHAASSAASSAASVTGLAALRAAIAARIGVNAAIAPQRRQLMMASVEEKLAEAAEPAHFLRGVLAAVVAGAPLDLDALLAPQPTVAAAPDTPAQLVAAALTSGDAAAISRHWQALLRAHGPRIRAGLRHYGRNASVRRALAQALPQAIFIDLAGLLDGAAPAILRELLTPSGPLQVAVGDGAAWAEWTTGCRLHALTALTGAAGGERLLDPGALLRAAAAADSPRHAALLAALPAQFGAAPRAAPRSAATATAAAQPRVTAALARQQQQGNKEQLGQQEQEQKQQRRQPVLAGRVRDAAAPAVPVAADSTESLVVGNAGMVLAGPYLPRLFGALGLTADGKFVDEEAAGRAVHLLQYMVTGESKTPEYQLVLNKILCGLPTATPVPAGIHLTDAERECIEGMVQAMVAHAKVLGSCSVAAMRQTFFARTADLQLADEAWQLRVHPGPFDMLLDRLPWGYSLIKFGWMARPVHVAWRQAS